MKGTRSDGLAFALRVAVAMTGRWKTAREIAVDMGVMPDTKNWGRSSQKKRIIRCIRALEDAGFPVQSDVDDSKPANEPRNYYRLSKGWM